MIFFKKLFKELINEINNPSSTFFNPKSHDFIQLDKELKKENAFIVLDNNKYVIYKGSLTNTSPFILESIKHNLPTENTTIKYLLSNNDYNFPKDFIEWKQKQVLTINSDITIIQDKNNREIAFQHNNQSSPILTVNTPNIFNKEISYEVFFLHSYFNIRRNIFSLSNAECFNKKIKKDHLLNHFRSACEKIIYSEDFKL